MSRTSALLTVELIPQSAFRQNLRTALPRGRWDEMRRACYRSAGYRCEICGGTGPTHPVEAHEIWDWSAGVQSLVRLIALCPPCHEVKHIGLADVRGNGERARRHLAIVNDWSMKQVEDHIADAFVTWSVRGRKCWKLDLTRFRYGGRCEQ